VLAARRGLGVDEMNLASPAFAAAVRWAVFAETAGADFGEMKAAAEAEVPEHLRKGGAELVEFRKSRERIRGTVKDLEAVLFPRDDNEALTDG